MAVGRHGPKTPHGRRGDGNPQLGNVSFEKGANESLPPNHAVIVGLSKERPGKATTQPKGFKGIPACLPQIETRKLQELHAPGEGFGDTSDNVRRSTVKDNETGSILGAVDKNAQNSEKLRYDLNFVQDHDSLEPTEHHLGVLESLRVGPGSQVEIGCGPALSKDAGKRRLAALPGAKECCYGRGQSFEVGGSVNHGYHNNMKTRNCTAKIRGISFLAHTRRH